MLRYALDDHSMLTKQSRKVQPTADIIPIIQLACPTCVASYSNDRTTYTLLLVLI